MGYEPELSNKGNINVVLGGEGSPLVLTAHLDTLGAMVRSIKENGRLRPTTPRRGISGTQQTVKTVWYLRVMEKMYTGVVLNTEPSAHVADENIERKKKKYGDSSG